MAILCLARSLWRQVVVRIYRMVASDCRRMVWVLYVGKFSSVTVGSHGRTRRRMWVCRSVEVG
jgi:hypothetical protein